MKLHTTAVVVLRSRALQYSPVPSNRLITPRATGAKRTRLTGCTVPNKRLNIRRCPNKSPHAGKLHRIMKAMMPSAVFIGFTGTPLLARDKGTRLEVFGDYIHTYKFSEGVEDGTVLDLVYEARDIDQRITSQGKVDQWFELKTQGLTDIAKAQLKQRWGTMQKVLSARDRLETIDPSHTRMSTTSAGCPCVPCLTKRTGG